MLSVSCPPASPNIDALKSLLELVGDPAAAADYLGQLKVVVDELTLKTLASQALANSIRADQVALATDSAALDTQRAETVAKLRALTVATARQEDAQREADARLAAREGAILEAEQRITDREAALQAAQATLRAAIGG